MDFNLTLVLEVVTFFILLFLLNKFVFTPLVKKLDERKQHIDDSLKDIDRLKQEASKDKEDTKAFLLEAKKTALKIKEEAFSYGEKLKEEAQVQAAQEAQKMRERGLKDLDLYLDKVKEELRMLSGELSFEIASKILAQEIDRKKHKDLVEESLQVLHEQRNNNL